MTKDTQQKTILVTGGAGYIGSHACVELLEAGYKVVVIDNLSNSKAVSLDRVQEITNKTLSFIEGDLRNKSDIESVFEKHNIDAVIHFAGLKAVGESVEIPIDYYQNNIVGTLNLLEVMNDASVKKIVFSSSATVYGGAESQPIKENSPLSAINPYGRSKLIIEEVLQDIYKSDSEWNISNLRYFNPVGAHKSGLIGEDPNGVPNNLMPYISQVAVGKLEQLNVFGSDYPTKDGTGVRDYIHVVDLAKGHISALAKLNENPGLIIHNLGTGKGYSVLEIVKAFEKATGKKVNYQVVERREGDIAICYADPSKAKSELDWHAKENLDAMCKDTWRWQFMNSEGYTK